MADQSAAEVLSIKAAVRERDGMACVNCGKPEANHVAEHGKTLEVHRVAGGGPYTTEPGICRTLCQGCHKLAHGFSPSRSKSRASPPFSLPLPPDLRSRAESQARRFGMNLSTYIRMSLSMKVIADEGTDPR